MDNNPRDDVINRVDAIFRQFRKVFIPMPEIGSGEIKRGGRYGLALDPLSPWQALRNPRVGRYVLMRHERSTRHDDSALLRRLWVGNILGGFYALAVLDGAAARVAWFRFAGGGSIRDCASQSGLSYWMTRNYLTGEKEPDLYAFWDARFSRIATPTEVYPQKQCVSK